MNSGDNYKRSSQLKQRIDKFLGKEHSDSPTSWKSEAQKLIGDLQGYLAELEKKHLELEESRNRYFNLYESAPIGYLTFDEEGCILEANSTFSDMLGVERRHLIGNHFIEYVKPDHHQNFDERCREAFSRGTKQSCEVSLVKEDGSEIWVAMAAVVVYGAEISFKQLRASVVNITSQRQAQKELEQVDERFRLFYENSPLGYQSLDKDGCFLDVNQTWLDNLDYNREEVIGRWFGDFLAPEYVHSFQKNFSRHKAKGYINGVQLQVVRKDGSKIYIELDGRIGCDKQGNFEQTHCVVRDITDRIQFEKVIRKTEKLESVGILAGGIAHSFNNLLTGILGNVSFAKLDIDPKDSAFALLDEAEKAGWRARNLTQQLLSFAQGGEPVKKVVSVGDWINDAATLALTDAGVALDISLVDDLHQVEVDIGQMSQVVHNIVMNSIQAMEDGGKVSITAKNINLDQNENLPVPAGEYVSIAIRDIGSGIPEEDFPKLFDPYFTTKDGASGLGLAAAYSIVKKHEGHIDVESREDVGTTFYIYLPASSRKAPQFSGNTDKRETMAGRILVMDDEEFIRDLAARILSKFGYEVDCASDSKTTVEMYKQAFGENNPYTAVLLDLTIPGGVGGEKTIQLLKEINPDIKAVVCSGFFNDPVLADYENYGFSGVLAKPYKAEELYDVVTRLVQKNPKPHRVK